MSAQQKRILLTLGFFLLLPYTQFSGMVIRLFRTACFGACPVYQLMIYDDGTVLYEGYNNVEVKGVQSTKIPRGKVNELITEFNKADFFSLENRYRDAVTDGPIFMVAIRIGARAKMIEHYGCRPQALTDLEYRIDEIVGSDQWVGQYSYLRQERMKCR